MIWFKIGRGATLPADSVVLKYSWRALGLAASASDFFSPTSTCLPSCSFPIYLASISFSACHPAARSAACAPALSVSSFVSIPLATSLFISAISSSSVSWSRIRWDSDSKFSSIRNSSSVCTFWATVDDLDSSSCSSFYTACWTSSRLAFRWPWAPLAYSLPTFVLFL